MDKATVSNFFKNVQTTVNKHSPTILTGVGIVGMIGTTVMAVQATPKAVKLLERKKKENPDHKLTPIDVVKTTWKCYLPAAITGSTSIVCLIKANSISMRRNAALATTYNLTRTALTEYKEKVVETLGEKKEQAIIDKIAKDKVEKDPVTSREVIVTDGGNTLCYDALCGRYFMSDYDTISKATNRLNRALVTEMYVSLNDFYDEIGLSHVAMGDDVGWNIDDGEIDVLRSSQLAEDGRPCLVISFDVAPKYGYSNFM